MRGAIARSGRAPAAQAAAALVVGTFLGAWSVAGETAGGLLAALCGGLLVAAAGRTRTPARVLAFWSFWLAAGFLSGLLRVAAPARESRETFWRLPPGKERADRVEGVLADFWSGLPPRAHGRLRAERVWIDGRWRRFPSDVFLFVSGELPVSPVADRGDRCIVVGHLEPEGVPASERDIATPYPSYRLSAKSALRFERRDRTLLSALAAPNLWLFDRLPAPGARDAAFDRDVRAPLAALLLGRTSELDRGMVARYRRGGLYHLLVISGLHVALAAGILLALLRTAGIGGKTRDALLLAGIVVFVLVGGANPPAVRAGLVFGVYLSARLLERPVSALQAIGLSALVLFGVAPTQIWSVGTVLTFAAVCGIAAFTGSIRRWLPARPAGIFSGFAAALSAQAATAPILLWRFNVVSAGAWLTAPLTVPLAAALIACGAVLLAGFAAGLSGTPFVWLFASGSRVLEWLAERAAGVAFLRPTPPLPMVIGVSLLTAAAAFVSGNRRVRCAAAALALFLLLALRPGPSGPARGFSLEALDVGQGDALLLRWKRHAVLVDGGGTFDLDARDFGRTRLLPKLLDRGVTALDAAILTHPHPDHALGLFAVLEELDVGAFWYSTGDDENDFFRDLEKAARERKVPARSLAAGSSVLWRDARLRVVHSGGPRRKTDGVNNQSLVILFERDGRRVLLTGDAGAATEAALLRDGRVPRADLLKVGHHGSRGSTTPAFAAAVGPKFAMLSCGRGNRFGHPAPETLSTLRALRVPVLRTDLLSDVRADLLPGQTRLAWRGLP
jgi:competence protein ComEC